MKILVPLAILVLCICCYFALHRTESPSAATAAAGPAPDAIAEATPKPAAQKLYYHSLLEAPAMPTNVHTVSSYYSTNPVSVWKVVPAPTDTTLHPATPSNAASTSLR